MPYDRQSIWTCMCIYILSIVWHVQIVVCVQDFWLLKNAQFSALVYVLSYSFSLLPLKQQVLFLVFLTITCFLVPR